MRPRRRAGSPKPIHERLNCIGYYGFGGGYAMALGATNEDRGSYCQTCPLHESCWEQHKERVRDLFPDLVAVFDEMVEEAGGRGDLAVKRFHDEFGGTEPYLSVMMGNLEDGILAQKKGQVKDRGEGTLPYPFMNRT